MPRPSSYSPPDRRKSIVWRRVTLICEPALILYYTICGTAFSTIQFVGPPRPRPSCSTKQYLLHLSIACALSFHTLFHFMFYQYCTHMYVCALLQLLNTVYLQSSQSSKQCVLSSKCFICSAPLKKQLRCLTQMRFAVKHSSPFPGVLSNYQAFI